MEPNTEKLILAIVMFLVTALCSLIPFAPFSVFRHELNSRFNTIASCFSGGVFIAVCFLDMMPDIEEIFETIKTQLDVTLDFSFSGMVICLGFFFVLSLDQLILVCKERNNSVTPLEEDDQAVQDVQGHCHSPVMTVHSTLRLIMFIVALSVHSIFEGLAIGLEDHEISLFIGVMIHKSIMAFLLGFTLSKATFKPLIFTLWIILFATASPVGICLGMLIHEYKQNICGLVANGILQGMAGGTFLYITYFEVLNPEFAHTRHKMLKTLTLLSGFTIMAIVIYFSG